MRREQYYSTTASKILNTLNGCARALPVSLVIVQGSKNARQDLRISKASSSFTEFPMVPLLIPNISKGTKGPWKRKKKESMLFPPSLSRKVTKKGKLAFLEKPWPFCILPDFWSFPELLVHWATRGKETSLCPMFLCWFGWFLNLHGFIIKTYLGTRSLSHCIQFLQKPFKV